MNINKLNALPELANKHNIDLLDGEKVVFNASPTIFGDENDTSLCGAMKPEFTLTNKRIIADNGVGFWTIDIPEDITNIKKVEYGKWIFKGNYFLVSLNFRMVYDNGKHTLNGFRFYFNKKDTAKFEEIVNSVFS